MRRLPAGNIRRRPAFAVGHQPHQGSFAVFRGYFPRSRIGLIGVLQGLRNALSGNPGIRRERCLNQSAGPWRTSIKHFRGPFHAHGDLLGALQRSGSRRLAGPAGLCPDKAVTLIRACFLICSSFDEALLTRSSRSTVIEPGFPPYAGPLSFGADCCCRSDYRGGNAALRQ